jgi:uncharacterized protein YggE
MNSIQERAWKIGTLVGVVLAIFLAAVAIKEIKSISYVGKENGMINSISVNGKGEETVIPDVATFSFSVTESAKAVEDAQSKTTDRTNAALKAVRAAGVEDKDIKTTSYSINPKYEYSQGPCTNGYCPNGKNVLTGYEVTQTVEVKIRELKKAGSIFSAIGSLNVQNVNGLSFSIDDIDTIKAKARAKAIIDAQAKAKVLAQQLGVKIVRITSYYDASNDMPYYGREGMGGDMMTASAVKVAAPTPEIPTGEQEVVSNVTITYEIK